MARKYVIRSSIVDFGVFVNNFRRTFRTGAHPRFIDSPLRVGLSGTELGAVTSLFYTPLSRKLSQRSPPLD